MDKKFAGIGAAIGFATVLWCALLWQPERQVRKHQQHLLAAVERRDWNRLAPFVAENYSDRWHHDKTFLLGPPREVFRQFLFLGVTGEEQALTAEDGSAVVTAKVTLQGSGGPFAEMAMEMVNSLHAPFRFHWRKQSWKPWDWQLVEIEHPDLQIPEL